MTIDQFSFLALAIGALVGLALGVTGAGGSLLAIPLLVYVLGVKVQSAAAISLVVVAVSALLGVYQRRGSGEVKLRTALVFSGTGAVGAWAGALGHRLVREETILLLFGIVMIVATRQMWRQGYQPDAKPAGESCAERFPRTCWIKGSLIGLGVGLLTGFFGIGGGFLIVPALVLGMEFPIRMAVGTSLLIIALVAAGGIVGHLPEAQITGGMIMFLLSGAALGMVAATRVVERVSPTTLSKGFVILSGCIATALILHNGMKLFGVAI